jgi:hypothetical protein
LIKTGWGFSEDWAGCIAGDQRNEHDGSNGGAACFPNDFAFEDYTGQAIVARQYDMASAWTAGSWSLNLLANFFYASGAGSAGIGPFGSGCPTTTIDGGRQIPNCKIDAPRIVMEPDGTTAIALYETYNGTFYDIQAHRYNGAAWSAFSTIDAGSPEAHAPQIVMDNSGNGVAVWAQKDSSGKYRIYTRNNSSGAWAATDAGSGCASGGLNGSDDGICNIDGNVGAESAYSNPVVAMTNPGGTDSALALFLGWSVLDNTTRLYYATGP